MAAFASGRGGSTMPTIASRVRSLDQLDQVAAGLDGPGVEVALRDHHHPLAGVGDLVVGLERQVPVVVGDRHQGAVGVAVASSRGRSARRARP